MTCKYPECADVLGHRHAEDYAAIWDYNAQPKEIVECCNLCGSRSHGGLIPPEADRYGYAVWRAQCGSCGLDHLKERMTREAYARFYETAYRPLVSAFHGRDVMLTIEKEQQEYGFRLAKILSPWATPRKLSLLDVGGSTGVVANVIRGWLPISRVVLLDPATSEAARALDFDIEVYARTVEDWDSYGERFDLITLCQTADHLLDLMGSLKKIRTLLSPDGLFWSDIVDFDVTREVKIDHPFNLTERTYRMFLEKAGFKLLQINYAPDGKHIGFLAR